MQAIFKVTGMSCQGCVSSIEGALKKTPGIDQVAVDLKGAKATVDFDAAKISPTDIEAKINDLGFDAQSLGDGGLRP